MKSSKKFFDTKSLVNYSMKKVIGYPKTVLLGIFFLTLLFSFGLTRLKLDPSLEYIVPKEDPVYRLGQRAKVAFADSKTFLLSAFQSVDGVPLFSQDVFLHIEKMVKEISEYREFDVTKEDSRLQSLLQLSHVEAVVAEATQQNSSPKPSSGNLEDELDKQFLPNESATATEAGSLEDELDKQFLQNGQGGSVDALLAQQNSHSSEDDIWDINKPLTTDHEAKPLRARYIYSYQNYKPVTLEELGSVLDDVARLQLQTILSAKDMKDISPQVALKKSEFKKILEAWEDLYLFKSMMVVKSFINPISGQDVRGEKDSLTPIRFIEKDREGNFILPKTAQEFAAYKEKISLNPLNKSSLYSQNSSGEIDALATALTFRYLENYESLISYFWPLLEKYDTAPVKMYSIGSLVIQEFIGKYMASDLISFVPLVFLVVLLTFFFNFRSLRGVVLPSFAVVLGMVWTMGTMGLLGIRISMLVSILPALLIAIGSSYSIHVFNQYMKDLKKINDADGEERSREMRKSVLHIFPTVFLASITTIISFLTLVTNQVVSLREFGIFAGLGSFYASVIAFVMIPAVLVLLPRLKHEKFFKQDGEVKEHLVQKLVNVIGNFSITYSTPVMAVSTLLVVAGVVGMFKVKVETSPMTNFKESSYVRQADTFLGNHFDGTFVLNLIMDSGKSGGVKDPEFLNFIENLQEWSQQAEQKENLLILHVNSFADFVKRINMAMHADNPAYFTIPEQRATVVDYLELFSGDDLDANGRPDDTEQFVDQDYRRVNILIRTGTYKDKSMTTASNDAIQKKVNEFLQNLPNPNGYKWFFVGEGSNFSILANYVTIGQIQNILSSLIIISLLLFYLFRSFKVGLVGIIPVSVGVTFVYGAMGFLNIPLDIPKVILASVAIGIGVDNTIHFMKTLTHYLEPDVSLETSLRKAHKEAGLAVIYTSLALILGFSVLMLSNFVPVYYLGLLVAGVMFSTTFGALVVLPAVIKFLNLKLRTDIQLSSFEES